MSQKKSVSIHAILTTLSPLHITSPESFRFVIDPVSGYGRVVNGSSGAEAKGIACAGIQRMRFGPGAEGLEFGVPSIVGNNGAGHLRRLAAQIVLDVLRSKGQQIKLSTYSAITCGAVNGIPDSRDPKYEEYRKASLHPLVGLFGGGPRLLPRRAQIHPMYPVMEELRSRGFSIKHPNAGSGKSCPLNKMTYGAAFRRGDDVSNLLDVDRMAASVEDFESAHKARQALIFEDMKKKDEDEKGSRHSTKAWSAYEFVAPGIDFDVSINLNNVTDAQVGLFLLALDAFSKQHIGGQSRNGLGRIGLNDVVLVMETESGRVESETVFNNNSLIRTSPDVQPYLAAWADAALAINAADLDDLMEPAKVDSEEEKAVKAEAKAARAEAKKTAKSAAKA